MRLLKSSPFRAATPAAPDGFSLDRRSRTDPEPTTLARSAILLSRVMRFSAGNRTAVLHLVQTQRCYGGSIPKMLVLADRADASAVFGFPYGEERVIGTTAYVLSQLTAPDEISRLFVVARREFTAFKREWASGLHRLPMRGVPLLSSHLSDAGYFAFGGAFHGTHATLDIAHVNPGTDYRRGQRIGQLMFDVSSGRIDAALSAAPTRRRQQLGCSLLAILGSRVPELLFSREGMEWIKEQCLRRAIAL